MPPKDIHCPKCDSQRFIIAYHDYTIADFSTEGAIEGHPFVRSGGESFDSIFCDECSEPIEGDLIQTIREEVI